MALTGIPDSGLERLRSQFGDSILIDGDAISIHTPTTTPASDAIQSFLPESSLSDRARAIADAGANQILGLGSGNDVAPWPRGFDTSSTTPEILASTSAVAVGRKLLYHELWNGSAEAAAAFAGLIRKYLPDEVAVMVQDNHVHAWRPDLLTLTPEAIQALSVAGYNGVLLGYGQNMGVLPYATVIIQDADGLVIGGFQAPAATAKVYAASRAKDFTDALGQTVRVLINGEEVAL